MFRKLFLALFRPTRVINSGYFSYEDADALIKEDPCWQIGKQEDSNIELGMVYLEKRVPVTE